MQNTFLPLISGLKRPSAFVYTGDLFSLDADFLPGDLLGDFVGDFSETSFFSLTSGSSSFQCFGLFFYSLFSWSTYYIDYYCCFCDVPETGWKKFFLSGDENYEVLWGAAMPPAPKVTYDLALFNWGSFGGHGVCVCSRSWSVAVFCLCWSFCSTISIFYLLKFNVYLT